MKLFRQRSTYLLILFFSCLLSLTLAGCTTYEAGMDQDQFLNVAMDYEENQIMDNVIRAKEDFPIMQFDIKTVSAIVKNDISAGVNGSRTGLGMFTGTPLNSTVATNSNTSTASLAAGAGSTILKQVVGTAQVTAATVSSVSRVLGFTSTNDHTNTAEFDVCPVLLNNEVYQAYRDYLANNEDALLDTSMPKYRNGAPKEGPDSPHIGKKWRGVFYWIPEKRKKEFFNLCLIASVTRNSPTATLVGGEQSNGPIQDTILGFSPEVYQNLNGYNGTALHVNFRDPVAVDWGAATAVVSGVFRDFTLMPDGGKRKPDEKSNWFYLVYDPTDIKEEATQLQKDLKGQVVDIRLRHNVPSASSVKLTIPLTEGQNTPEIKALNDVSDQIRMFRLQQ
jgi:hypothetical protein